MRLSKFKNIGWFVLPMLMIGLALETTAAGEWLGTAGVATQESKNDEQDEVAEEGGSQPPSVADEQSPTLEVEDNGESESDALILKNGSLETHEDGVPTGWIFPDAHRQHGFEFDLDDEVAQDGKWSGKLVSTQADFAEVPFTMLNQIIDPTTIRGKRVRYRAAVRTDELATDCRVQLWFRVDRESEDGKVSIGAFDNMQERPIRTSDWKHFDIVADVDDDAKRLTVGILLIGKGIAWIDDASLEVVSEEAKTTAMPNLGAKAANAPPQAFFNHWLWLAVILMALLVVSQLPNSWVQRFSLRFAIVYWVLYSFPSAILGIVGSMFGVLASWGVEMAPANEKLALVSGKFTELTQTVVHWAAHHLFGIEGQLVLPNGSGDTTFAYIRCFVCLLIALVAATVWSLAYWRKSDHVWLRDILRTYLRYVLVLTMLGYGLHKSGFITTQFARGGMPQEFQLTRTFGEASPMGLLWTFMAASPMYTFFAGMAEVVGGVLLVFRRTATLGALVVFGVMLNVMMLNYCFDVPVKLYSSHLTFMAVFLILPDIPRLANVLLLNRATEPSSDLSPPYLDDQTVWIYRVFKTVVVFCAVAWPIYEHTSKEIQFYREGKLDEQIQRRAESEHVLINRGYRWINEYPYNR